MKVEIWSDFVCPFCYIGKKKFQAALKEFQYKEDVEVIYRSFELDHNSAKAPKGSIHEIISKKYGLPLEKAIENNNFIVEKAKEVGLNYDFDSMIPTNTFDAHRLSHFAAEEDKMERITERILKAYFEEGMDISDHQVLASLAEEIGLNKEEALKVLGGSSYSEDVLTDQAKAQNIGVTGVPFFLFNEERAISGAESVDTFLQTMYDTWTEEEALKISEGKENQGRGICENGVCRLF